MKIKTNRALQERTINDDQNNTVVLQWPNIVIQFGFDIGKKEKNKLNLVIIIFLVLLNNGYANNNFLFDCLQIMAGKAECNYVRHIIWFY